MNTDNIRLRACDRCKCGGFFSIVHYEVVDTGTEQYYKFVAKCTNCESRQAWLRKDRRVCPVSL